MASLRVSMTNRPTIHHIVGANDSVWYPWRLQRLSTCANDYWNASETSEKGLSYWNLCWSCWSNCQSVFNSSKSSGRFEFKTWFGNCRSFTWKMHWFKIKEFTTTTENFLRTTLSRPLNLLNKRLLFLMLYVTLVYVTVVKINVL